MASAIAKKDRRSPTVGRVTPIVGRGSKGSLHHEPARVGVVLQLRRQLAVPDQGGDDEEGAQADQRIVRAEELVRRVLGGAERLPKPLGGAAEIQT